MKIFFYLIVLLCVTSKASSETFHLIDNHGRPIIAFMKNFDIRRAVVSGRGNDCEGRRSLSAWYMYDDVTLNIGDVAYRLNGNAFTSWSGGECGNGALYFQTYTYRDQDKCYQSYRQAQSAVPLDYTGPIKMEDLIAMKLAFYKPSHKGGVDLFLYLNYSKREITVYKKIGSCLHFNDWQVFAIGRF